MTKENIEPILNEPALYIKNKKILIIADLHIGIEEELKESGVNTGSQTEKIFNKIKKISKKEKPEKIILLGDIKHNIPNSTYQERMDVKNFLERIKKISKVEIIPGNHDGFIKKLCPDDVKIHSSDGIIIDEIALIHGHKWPKKEILEQKNIIMGHTHPTIMLTDRMNIKTYEPCWIKTNFIRNKIKEKYDTINNPNLYIVPAFNILCGGIAINKEGIIGPIKNIVDLDNSRVFLLDGTLLGKVKNL